MKPVPAGALWHDTRCRPDVDRMPITDTPPEVHAPPAGERLGVERFSPVCWWIDYKRNLARKSVYKGAGGVTFGEATEGPRYAVQGVWKCLSAVAHAKDTPTRGHFAL